MSYLGAVKLAVGVMGMLIVVGVVILAVTVVQRLSGGSGVDPTSRARSEMPPPSFDEVSLPLPAGAVIQDMEMDGRRLILRLLLAGDRPALMLVDLDTGRRLGLIRLEAAAP